MTNKKIINSYNIITSEINNDWKSISKYVRQLMTACYSLYRTNQFSYLEQLIEVQYRKIACLGERQKSQESIPYQIGVAIGTLESMKQVVRYYYKQEKIVDLLEKQTYINLPHIEQIIGILQQKDIIQHGKLAKEIEIDKSTLTPIMKQMEKSGLVSAIISGRNKYYSLSDAGKRYAHQISPIMAKADLLNQKQLQASLLSRNQRIQQPAGEVNEFSGDMRLAVQVGMNQNKDK